MTRTVYVVPHCHWDREWYQPHELFRWRLVQMIDELIEHMERHPEYARFNLDGQTIVIEDYLELRPENEGRLRALIEAGRIVIGPWLVQPDEFLPSGESHIRSLQRGMRFAERLGGSLRVGHCADQFGHIAQMPQIMAQLGITSACLWRGVPDAIPGWSFWWEAPVGTRLPVLYLRNSYSSGWRLPADPDDLVARVEREEVCRKPGEPALLMNGTDHSRMEKHVPAALAAAAGRGYDFRLATLADYERAMLSHGIDDVTWQGELRSPDRSNVLVGVLSSRMPIKQRDFAVSSLLERVAEPLALLAHLRSGPDGAPALKHAWRLALENTPHDSICGCSVDQVHREMVPRYDRAEQLAGQVARESLAHVVAGLEVEPPGAIAVFRPVPFAPALVECEVPASWRTFGALRLPGGETIPVEYEPAEDPAVLQHDLVSPRGALRHLDFLREGRYDVFAIERMEWTIGEDRHLRVETTVGNAVNVVDEERVRAELREAVRGGRAQTAEVIVRRAATVRARAVLPASDAIGVELLQPATAESAAPAVRAGKDWIENGLHRVEWRGGRLRITDLRTGLEIRDACRLVSEGDRGDEYNADILADAIDEPADSAVVGTAAGHVTATLTMAQTYRVPAGLAPGRRKRRGPARPLSLLVAVRVHAGIPRVDFDVTLQNPSRDHRLRVHIRLPFEPEAAITENQFHVASRPLDPPPWNGTSNERPPTTFPQKTFAAFERDGLGLAVMNRGLPEGEVVRDRRGRAVFALTLLRCVGWLSRRDLASRKGHAGPQVPTPDAQEQGEHHFTFAITTYGGSWAEAGILPLAHAFAHRPFALATNAHGGEPGGAAPLARFASDAFVPSLLGRSEVDGAPLFRGWNASAGEREAGVQVPQAVGMTASLVDLAERPAGTVREVHGEWRFTMRGWEIATLRLVGDGGPQAAGRRAPAGDESAAPRTPPPEVIHAPGGYVRER